MIRSRWQSLRGAGLALAVLFAVGQGVKADDSYTVTYGSGPGVSVSYTGVSNQGTMALPFSVTDNTTSASFTGYCVDLYHDQYNDQTYTAPAFSLAAIASSSILANAFPYTAYSDLANRMNYMGYVFGALGQASLTGDQEVAGAVQLALWSLIDKKFSYSTSDGNLKTDTNIILGLLGSAGASGSGGDNQSISFVLSNGNSSSAVTLNAYALGTSYSSENGELILSHPTPGSPGYNQNLVAWGQNISLTAVPEPSSFAFAGLGALAFAGYALRRRSKA